tara:strand:+ start:1810 stop:2241 length:432 start_codon:yes stop_codon:yes gene_type:complete
MSNERYILITEGNQHNLLHSHTCCDQSKPTISFKLENHEPIESAKVAVKCNNPEESVSDAPVVDANYHMVGNVQNGIFTGVNYSENESENAIVLDTKLLNSDDEGSLSRLKTPFDKEDTTQATPYANNAEGSGSRLQTEHDAI